MFGFMINAYTPIAPHWRRQGNEKVGRSVIKKAPEGRRFGFLGLAEDNFKFYDAGNSRQPAENGFKWLT
jgi:hypothetical protein